MKIENSYFCVRQILMVMVILGLLSSCSLLQTQSYDSDDSGSVVSDDYDYKLAPGDILDIFVWRNPEVSAEGIPVRPDGKISAPLVDSLMANGKTTGQLAEDIEAILSEYIKEPLVTVTVKQIRGGFEQQVRVVGEATNPSALPFSKDMTVLDVMIAVGGLTEFADGNKATIVRSFGGENKTINVRLDDLLKSGEVGANKSVYPGDILVIPEALF